VNIGFISLLTKEKRMSLRKMFSVPKSKSPWDAMTKGSTGGWASGIQPWGPAITAASGAIPGVGPMISTALGTIGAAGGGTGFQGTDKGWSNLWRTPLGALSGYGLGSVGSGVGGAIKGGLSSGGGGIMSGFQSGMGNYLNTPIIPGMSGTSGSNIGKGVMGLFGGKPSVNASELASYTGNMPSYASYQPSSIMSSFTGAGTPSTSSLLSGIGTSGQSLTSLFNPYGAISTRAGTEAAKQGINWGEVAGGLATSLAPSLMSEKTQIPESALYGNITSKLLGGQAMSELGALAREKLTGNLNDQFSPVPDEYYNASTRRLDEAYDKAESDFTKQWQATRPGSDVQGDSAYREGINKIRQNRAREKAGLAAELDYRREADYYDRQYQNISQALGVDNQTMQDYMSLAQLDSERLALNTGITLGEAAQFKEIFGNLGGYLMQRGMGLNNPTIALQNLIQRLGGNNGTFR